MFIFSINLCIQFIYNGYEVNPMFKAVLFDLDGVLVNSEVLQQNLSEEFIDVFDYDIPKENFYSLIGAHRNQNPWQKVVTGCDIKGDSLEVFVDKIRAFKQERLKNIDYNNWLFDDIKDSLAHLKSKGYKIACASSSSIIYIQAILAQCNIEHFFDILVTGDDFKESKPNPEIYLYCANQFNLDPSACLVIEDSPYGILAAKNAGMMVYARKDVHFSLDQSLADKHFDDLREIVLALD